MAFIFNVHILVHILINSNEVFILFMSLLLWSRRLRLLFHDCRYRCQGMACHEIDNAGWNHP